MPGSWNANETN